jgi:hypothetical protein
MQSMKWPLVFVLLVVPTLGLHADAGRPMPVFSVTSPTGAVVTSSALSSQPRWLLVYVSPACRSCDRLIESMKQWQSPVGPSRTVVVVRGSDAAHFVAEHQSSGLNAAWYVDDHDDGWRSLDLKSAPALIGIESGQIKWSVSGVLNDPKSVESVVKRWLE